MSIWVNVVQLCANSPMALPLSRIRVVHWPSARPSTYLQEDHHVQLEPRNLVSTNGSSHAIWSAPTARATQFGQYQRLEPRNLVSTTGSYFATMSSGTLLRKQCTRAHKQLESWQTVHMFLCELEALLQYVLLRNAVIDELLGWLSRAE
jgi:hypothetical protein